MKAILGTLSFLIAPPLLAQGFPAGFSEDTLQAFFHFEESDAVKFSECDGDQRHTCTYVWGQPSSKDAARLNAGLPPSGNKLTVVFAQAKRPEDFDRVRAIYSDGVDITSLGVMAVWSTARKQLSLITADNLIIHVNTEASGDEAAGATAQLIAEHILGVL